MSEAKMKKTISASKLFPAFLVALATLFTASAHASTPGITGTSFHLTAQTAFISQPDGASVYSWGYGCDSNFPQPGFLPAAITTSAVCNTMQVPGPTLIVTEGQTVTVTLTNNLPASAGNTSILFPGFNVCVGTLTGASSSSAGNCIPSNPAAPVGLMTSEAVPGGTVTYSFYAASPGTRAYYSGTQGDLQIEMGLYGAIVVLPSNVPSNCTAKQGNFSGYNGIAETTWGEHDFRLAPAAYDHSESCYDREYLFQFSEMDPNIHYQTLTQVKATAACTAGTSGCILHVATEPYHPAYFLINGRSMPDDMDPNYSEAYPHQPYNGDPHAHPGELVLLRIIGQGRWQHPFHEHGNHVRILGRDGNLIVSATDANALAGPLLFTTTTTPGLAMDGIFYWTGRGLNWDAYAHHSPSSSSDPNATLTCTADSNGYNTSATAAAQINYYEWCADHNKPLETAPFGDVGAGGPATLPNANILTNGAWYSGSPYLGPDATTRATGGTCTGANSTTKCSTTAVTPPSGTLANPPSSEAGFAFMWHSHNEREITTSNAFPGGMLMMLLVDSREFVIDETN